MNDFSIDPIEMFYAIFRTNGIITEEDIDLSFYKTPTIFCAGGSEFYLMSDR